MILPPRCRHGTTTGRATILQIAGVRKTVAHTTKEAMVTPLNGCKEGGTYHTPKVSAIPPKTAHVRA
eukprot:scaffold9250_cov105-Isochrysis_galbana.AAC.6